MNDTVIVKCNVLNAVQSQEIIALKERIKRLEEAGELLTCMICRQDDYGSYQDEENAVNSWLKAKEAKP